MYNMLKGHWDWNPAAMCHTHECAGVSFRNHWKWLQNEQPEESLTLVQPPRGWVAVRTSCPPPAPLPQVLALTVETSGEAFGVSPASVGWDVTLNSHTLGIPQSPPPSKPLPAISASACGRFCLCKVLMPVLCANAGPRVFVSTLSLSGSLSTHLGYESIYSVFVHAECLFCF